MKNIMKYLLLALPLLWGCESDDTAMDEYSYGAVDPSIDSALSIVISGGEVSDAAGYDYETYQGNCMTFANNSDGIYTQSWTLSSVDCQFMVNGFDSEQSFADQAAADKGIVSTNTTEYIYFPTIGEYEVSLYSAFHSEVAGATYYESAGVWVYKTSYVVNVYEIPTLTAQSEVRNSAGDLVSGDVALYCGEKLYFSDVTTYSSDFTSEWSLGGEVITLESDGSYTFTTTGSFDSFTHRVISSDYVGVDNTETLDLSVVVSALPTVEASFEIYKSDGVTQVTGDITISRGDKLYFKNLSTGHEITTTWSYGSGDVITLSDDDSYAFSKAGVYSSIKLAVESSSDLYDSGSKSDECTLPYNITVESVQFAYTDIKLDIDSTATHANDDTPTIEITLNGEIATFANESDVTRGFTLSVEDYAGEAQSVSVTSVTADGATLKLALSDKIYQSDVVTLNYTYSEANEIVDDEDSTNYLESISDYEITLTGDTDMLADNSGYDFEAGTSIANNGWTKYVSASTASDILFDIDTTNAKTGDNSAVITVPSSLTSITSVVFSHIATGTSTAVAVTKGNYMIKHWVYVDSSSTASFGDNEYTIRYQDQTGSAWASHTATSSDNTGCTFPTTKGQWEERCIEVAYSSDVEVKYRFDFMCSGYYSNSLYLLGAIFYLDDFQLYPIR